MCGLESRSISSGADAEYVRTYILRDRSIHTTKLFRQMAKLSRLKERERELGVKGGAIWSGV